MDREDIFTKEDLYQARVYAKRKHVLIRGTGAELYDLDGRRYIDLMSGYGVAILGYGHPKIVRALEEQIEKLMICHGSFYNDARAHFLEELVRVAPRELDSVLMTNSGAEAVEAALKIALRVTGKSEIIAFVRGYHGKTFGALSATWEKKYKDGFGSLLPGFLHVPYGDIEKVRTTISDRTAAILVEPIQGEGGVRVPPRGFLRELRELATEKGVLLVLDEVQTGLMRTGKMFAFQWEGIVPDILILGKGLAGGLPVGAVLSNRGTMSKLGLGGHTSTMAGNPLVCAAGSATLQVLRQEISEEHVARRSSYFLKLLEELKELKVLREIRGRGLMIGLELRIEAEATLNSLADLGVLALPAGRNVVRFLPPLIISEQLIGEACAKARSALEVEDAKL
ncbi:MAG: aspartate aminotransferase family protein [Thermoproteota archaeon]